ncbi:hypothetical protein FKP32DRAFT_1688227 [Trametes sanguinea]|nr:hypothetical protein FKP32DRAFT_1688227 [Trametes sanguinea]
MDTFHETPLGAGCRIPPNATKLFYRWGMEERLRKASVKSQGILFAQYDSGSVVGSHEWEEEVLEETGGDFLLMHYSDLRRILAESAEEHGATLRGGCQVVSIEPDTNRPYVTLATGEVITGDVVIGADGCHVPPYHCRRIILEALGQEDRETPTGMQLFNVLLPESALNQLEDKELVGQLRQTGKVFTWFGPGYGALGFPVKEPTTGEPLFTIYVYASRADQNMTIANAGREELLESLKGCDPRFWMSSQLTSPQQMAGPGHNQPAGPKAPAPGSVRQTYIAEVASRLPHVAREARSLRGAGARGSEPRLHEWSHGHPEDSHVVTVKPVVEAH